jgi:DNA modification methylase/transposase
MKHTQLMKTAYTTEFGICIQGKAEEVLASSFLERYQQQIDLIFTSPPFPLNRKKKYGNLQGEKYIEWLGNFAALFSKCLKPTGSIVIEVGNSWEEGRPIMSTLALRALLHFLDKGNFVLCQQFIHYNPARLPSPAQWVNVERIRVKDSFNQIWWMAKTDRPKADNRRVLKEYSDSMQKLLESQKYNAGKRPSEFNIGATSFLQNNSGAIPSNVLTLSNTQSRTEYLNYCRSNNIQPHPARMPLGVPEFFIKLLTESRDIVLDPFAGSNTTGAAAEQLGREWIAVEPNEEYVAGSRGRFLPLLIKSAEQGNHEIVNKPSVTAIQITDDLWSSIEPLLPANPKKRKSGRPQIPNRNILRGVLYILSSDLDWEQLPPETGCGSGLTCLRRLREWVKGGVWHQIQAILVTKLDQPNRINWSRVPISRNSLSEHKMANEMNRFPQVTTNPI